MKSEYRTKIESTLIAMFPEVAITGHVTKKQLTAVKQATGLVFPSYLMDNRVAWGTYAVNFEMPSIKPVAVVTETETPIVTTPNVPTLEKVTVTSTTLIAMRSGTTLLLDECLEENEKVRIGSVDSYINIPLKDLEYDVLYPVVSFNMETGKFEQANLKMIGVL